MPASSGGRLRGGELLVAQPLQPAEEPHPVRELLRERGDLRRARVAQLLGPVVSGEVLGERAPDGELVQLRALVGRNASKARSRSGVRGAAWIRSRAASLAAYDAWRSISPSSSSNGPAAYASTFARCFVRQGGELGHVGDAQVERVEVAARGREVRRVLDRRDRLGGVERVDEHEVRAEAGRPPGLRREVGEVADAPRVARAHGVELGHHAPHLVREVVGQVDPVGREDQQPLAGLLAAAWRAAGGSRSGRSSGSTNRASPTSRPSTSRGGVQCSTWVASTTAAALRDDLQRERVAVGHVHQHLDRVPRAADGHRAAASGATGASSRSASAACTDSSVRRVDVERAEQRLHRLDRDRDVVALPVPVLPGDAAPVRELGECRPVLDVGHGITLGGVYDGPRAALAQLVEHRSCKADVVGSTPTRGSDVRRVCLRPLHETGLRRTPRTSPHPTDLELARRVRRSRPGRRPAAARARRTRASAAGPRTPS